MTKAHDEMKAELKKLGVDDENDGTSPRRRRAIRRATKSLLTFTSAYA